MDIIQIGRRELLVGATATLGTSLAIPKVAHAFAGPGFVVRAAGSLLTGVASAFAANRIEDYIYSSTEQHGKIAAKTLKNKMDPAFPDTRNSTVYKCRDTRLFSQKTYSNQNCCIGVFKNNESTPIGTLDKPAIIALFIFATEHMQNGDALDENIVPKLWYSRPNQQSNGTYRQLNRFETERNRFGIDFQNLGTTRKRIDIAWHDKQSGKGNHVAYDISAIS